MLYLDHNATTPVDPQVLAVMQPFFTQCFGNAASSTHAYGWQADLAVGDARKVLAGLLGAAVPQSIIFTSGTTESNNFVLKGLFALSPKPCHIITQKTEHESILEVCRFLQAQGCEVTFLNVDAEGHVSPDDVGRAIKKNTVLVSVMMANNEIGTIQPIKEIARVAHSCNVLMHTDAAQAVGKITVDVGDLGIDLLSFSGHKIYGPKGVGALYIKPRLPKIMLEPLLHGGGHEFGLRSGTVNVAAVVGLAKALEIAVGQISGEGERLNKLTELFVAKITAQLGHVFINGPSQNRLPGNMNMTLGFVDTGELIKKTPELAYSSGAACASGGTEPSHVIQAIGRSREEAKQSVRFGFGRSTTKQDVEIAAEQIVQAATAIRKTSLEFEMFEQNQKKDV